MAYHFYLDGTELPVTPGALSVKINNNNKTVTLIDQGDVNILKSPGLTEISFDALLPSQQYPFVNGEWMPPAYYLQILEYHKTNKLPLQFVVTRPLENGGMLQGTSMRVAVEDYEAKEDAGQYGTDMLVSINLKQYRDYGTKTVVVSKGKGKVTKARETDKAPKSDTEHKVKDGENLTTIAKKHYNDSSKWKQIYNANKSKIGSKPTNKIAAGTKLTIPRKTSGYGYAYKDSSGTVVYQHSYSGYAYKRSDGSVAYTNRG